LPPTSKFADRNATYVISEATVVSVGEREGDRYEVFILEPDAYIFKDVGDRAIGMPYVRCLVQAGAGDPRGRKLLAGFRPGQVHRFQATFVGTNEEVISYNCTDLGTTRRLRAKMPAEMGN
jgi:hypothetical protein